MSHLTIFAVRVVLALVFVGCLVALIAFLPLIAADLADLSPAYDYLRVPLIGYAAVAILTVLICVCCVWKLVSMVRQATVFSHAAFTFVNVIIATLATASMLTFVFGCILAPGDAVAPGVVVIIGGLGLTIAGMALIVVVLRALLAQAVARDKQAQMLEAELDEVI